jgi:hypothetical protein
MGLVMGSIPFLLQSKLTYTELGIFSIAGYPYALKLFWSPVVDACYSKHILSSFSAACHACVRCVCMCMCVCVVCRVSCVVCRVSCVVCRVLCVVSRAMRGACACVFPLTLKYG